MSGVNSKCSRGDLTSRRSKRLKQKDSTSTLAGTGSTAQMRTSTSPESRVDRVSNFPFERLDVILGYLAADCDRKELLNLRLVCSMFTREEVYFALKTNPALLPWVVLNDNSMDQVKTALSRTESGNNCVVKSLESYRRIFAPGCGLPLKLVTNRWTPELVSFLHDYTKEIIGFWICGVDFHGFPEDLGGIELPALEHAPFSAIWVCNNNEGFVKALSFWKKLVEASKILKTCQLAIRIPSKTWPLGPPPSPDDQVFHLVEWSRVNSLQCSSEFFVKASASNKLLGLQKLDCFSALGRVVPERHLSLENAANLTEMRIGRQIEWRLNHQMKNLKKLTLVGDITITCEQSPAIFLPNLEKIAVRDSHLLSFRNAFSGLVRGGGVYENVTELELIENWIPWNERAHIVATQLCDCFPKLTKLEWESKGVMFTNPGGPRTNWYVPSTNALKAAPVIFSKLDLLTRLKLRVSFVSGGREIVELVTGIRLEEIPVEKESWPTTLTGNPRSITNLKHLKSFDLQVSRGKITVCERCTSFLFTAAFRTMATLSDLSFECIIFEDTSCATEWQQLGRTIKMTGTNASSNGDEDISESSSEYRTPTLNRVATNEAC